ARDVRAARTDGAAAVPDRSGARNRPCADGRIGATGRDARRGPDLRRRGRRQRRVLGTGGARLEPSGPRRAADAAAGRRQPSPQARRAVGLRAAGEPADAGIVPRAWLHPAGDSGRTGYRADYTEALIPIAHAQTDPACRGCRVTLARFPRRGSMAAPRIRVAHDQPDQAPAPADHSQATPLLDAATRLRASAADCRGSAYARR